MRRDHTKCLPTNGTGRANQTDVFQIDPPSAITA
jgi:hypothetical protein